MTRRTTAELVVAGRVKMANTSTKQPAQTGHKNYKKTDWES
jgi:hypothetical protein